MLTNNNLPVLYAIQYSEFDINRGAFVYHETAHTIFSEDQSFQFVRNFVCPESNLIDKLIVLTIQNQKLIGCPVIIYDQEKYRNNRNEFRFNACFIIPSQADALKYEVAVRKLAKYLRTLEVDSCFLTNDALKREHLKPALHEIVRQINKNGEECSVKMHTSVFVNLKLLERRAEPPTVASSDVPMFCNNIDLAELEQMDQMTQRVIASIDGLRHVNKIAQDTDTELDLVKAAMQNLIYHNVIKLVPIFSYKNRYIVTPKIQELYTTRDLQKELVFFVVRSGAKDCVSFYESFRMICAFDHGSLVKDVVNKMKANNIDEKKLVQYCVLKGYLQRVRDYRISLDDSIYIGNNGNGHANGNSNGNEQAKSKMQTTLRELCDGTNDSDSLACLGYIFNSRSVPSARKNQQQTTASLDSYLTLWK
ncbi:unnamed protein product [Rotaria magnacalcarata]|uniref:Nitrogen permease regulator 2-like protein n=4 Tax=Rotaria magnacalcarata TaxID=392030 RepID=A0A816V2R1_9BILA|nr:unnamed protein product [Rotaria magnacalcarata]CAF1554874.1 unnamed protein product [Rotaria magnacalcarata]CAF1986360.1 unnamed protein product [Rotaria magnacalcarata]CAF2120908.1 unnamed protein product [Rotaria magnacalcarata]CAF2142490.1 unnamed protein product [Rotaria magnacalcarata]